MIKRSNMKILLLGGEGFIGRNIIDSLSSSFDCYSLGRAPSPFRINSYHFIEADPYRGKIDEFFNCYIHLIDNNISEQEFNLLKNINPKAHIILFSSAVIYANPTSEYSVRKLALEKIYAERCEKLAILRLFNVYGKYQIPYRQGSLVANILYNHLNDIPIQINDMNVKRDFIFAEDIGRYIEFIIANSLYGTYDLATGKMRSIKELCDVVQSAIETTLNIVDLKKRDIHCPSANRMIPCNIKSTDLESGLKKAFDFFKENNELIKRIVS